MHKQQLILSFLRVQICFQVFFSVLDMLLSTDRFFSFAFSSFSVSGGSGVVGVVDVADDVDDVDGSVGAVSPLLLVNGRGRKEPLCGLLAVR